MRSSNEETAPLTCKESRRLVLGNVGHSTIRILHCRSSSTAKRSTEIRPCDVRGCPIWYFGGCVDSGCGHRHNRNRSTRRSAWNIDVQRCEAFATLHCWSLFGTRLRRWDWGVQSHCLTGQDFGCRAQRRWAMGSVQPLALTLVSGRDVGH